MGTPTLHRYDSHTWYINVTDFGDLYVLHFSYCSCGVRVPREPSPDFEAAITMWYSERNKWAELTLTEFLSKMGFGDV